MVSATSCGLVGASSRTRSDRRGDRHCLWSASAYAERTARAVRASPGLTEHFRVRGTDVIGDKTESSHRGASPRTRSEHPGPHPAVPGLGAHLRARGANSGTHVLTTMYDGSPPRARSGRLAYHQPASPARSISAYAARTLTATSRPTRTVEHLRVRGADEHEYPWLPRDHGASPRTRSGLAPDRARRGGQRSMSAYAEPTAPAV